MPACSSLFRIKPDILRACLAFAMYGFSSLNMMSTISLRLMFTPVLALRSYSLNIILSFLGYLISQILQFSLPVGLDIHT